MVGINPECWSKNQKIWPTSAPSEPKAVFPNKRPIFFWMVQLNEVCLWSAGLIKFFVGHFHLCCFFSFKHVCCIVVIFWFLIHLTSILPYFNLCYNLFLLSFPLPVVQCQCDSLYLEKLGNCPSSSVLIVFCWNCDAETILCLWSCDAKLSVSSSYNLLFHNAFNIILGLQHVYFNQFARNQALLLLCSSLFSVGLLLVWTCTPNW